MSVVIRHRLAVGGRVVDGVSGRPLAGVRVQILRMPAPLKRRLATRAAAHGAGWDRLVERPDRTRTDVRGLFHFMDLPEGKYRLQASLASAGSRYGTCTTTVDVAGAGVAGGVTLRELKLPPTCVAGMVTTGTGTEATPVMLATVLFADGSGRTLTDAQGHYVLLAVETGLRDLTAGAEGLSTASDVADVGEPGTTVTVNLELQRK